MDKKGSFSTRYDSADAGTLSFELNAELEAEISEALETVRQVRADNADNRDVAAGLGGVEQKLQALRGSTTDIAAARAQIVALLTIPVGDGKMMRLDAYRKKAAKAALGSEAEYLEQVRKMVRNTFNNAALLMLNYEGDPVLARLVEDLKAVPLEDYKRAKAELSGISKSPQFWKYTEKKKEFLVQWLAPFKDQLGKPIEQMSEAEFQAALKKVEELRDHKLEEMTHLMVDSDRKPFAAHNRTMNPLINGKDETFWGGQEGRDEFISLMNRLITRFSFSLSDRYLIFRTKDSGFCYLAGFSDDAFEQAVTTKDGKLGLYPHLKVFVKNAEDGYGELTMEAYSRNAKAFYGTLKTAVVPFLRAAAIMVETELSSDIKNAFDMWG